jgi:PAS domain S-box-containing protein
MNLEFLSSLTFLLLAAAGLSLVLLWQSIISLRRDRLPIAFPIFQAGITLWLLAYTWEFSTLDLNTKILASKIEYVGIAISPTAWLVYTVNYAQLDRRLKLIHRWLLCIEPALVVILVWTNEFHRLIWRQIEIFPISPHFASLKIIHGPFFYFHTVYCYGLVVWATALLLRTLVRSPGLYRGQAATLLISASAPWLGNILYMINAIHLLPASKAFYRSDLSTLWLIDWTPFGFLITGVAVLWGRWRFRLWDVVPVARDTLVEGMRDGVLVLDRQNRIIDLNPAIQSVLNLPTARVLGQPASQILAPWPLLLNQLLETSDQHRLVTHNQSIEGKTYWYEISLSPLQNSRQKTLGQLLVWRDVTPQKIIELELARARDAAEAASQAKSRFLATMSHELRTPLNAILGYSELLQQDCKLKGYSDLIEDLSTIHTAGDNLLSLINNVLDFSKVEAGKFSIFLESFDVVLLVLEVSRIVEPLMQKNKNQLQVDCSEEIQLVYSDPGKIRQILLNILGNAAKFTDEGAVTLSVRPLDVERSGSVHRSDPLEQPASPSWIRFQVQDTGIGMTPEQLQRVFQAFVQAEESTSHHYGGTGLGLALSQSFCHMIGGAISVESTLGKGSTFTVDLPIYCPVVDESSYSLEK